MKKYTDSETNVTAIETIHDEEPAYIEYMAYQLVETGERIILSNARNIFTELKSRYEKQIR